MVSPVEGTGEIPKGTGEASQGHSPQAQSPPEGLNRKGQATRGRGMRMNREAQRSTLVQRGQRERAGVGRVRRVTGVRKWLERT